MSCATPGSKHWWIEPVDATEAFEDPVILTDETGMRSRKVIGQAIGIIMERYGLDEDRAFGFLRRVSRQTNVKLRFVAADVVGQLNRQRVDGAGN